MKAFTDIKQSKKLAEILPKESADQIWERIVIAGANLDVPEEIEYWHNGNTRYIFSSKIGIPCWSLTALLDILPAGKVLLHDKDNRGYKCICNNIDSYYFSNPIDTCVDIIIKLHEQKLI